MGFGGFHIGSVPGLNDGGGLGGLKELMLGPGLKPSYSLFNKISQQQQFANNKAAGYQTLGLNALARGFGNARTGVKQGSGVAKGEARDVAEQQQGAVQNSLVGRGLYGTNALESASRGIGSDLAKHLAWIDASTSDALGGIDMAEASALNQGYGGLASLATGFGEQQTALGGMLFPTLGNQQGLLGPLLGVAGKAIGAHSA